jgi:hypothetical protein
MSLLKKESSFKKEIKFEIGTSDIQIERKLKFSDEIGDNKPLSENIYVDSLHYSQYSIGHENMKSADSCCVIN